MWKTLIPISKFVGALSIFVMLGCSESSEEKRAYATAPIVKGLLVDSVVATGRVKAMRSVDVSSQLSGRIDEVYADFNDLVHPEEPLARLDPLRFQSRVEELEAALAVAKAELLSVEAVLAGATARAEEDERDYKRKADLALQGSLSSSELSKTEAQQLQSASALRAAEASRAIQQAAISAATASLNQAKIDLQRTVIRAPIKGIVIKRAIEPGQTVAVSLSAPALFTIVNDLAEIEVNARVDEADIGKVQVGQSVSFSVDAYPNRRFQGAVRQIRKAPEISQNVVAYSVVIEAANPNELMLPGMTALVEIVTARKKDALQVPNAALRFQMPQRSLPPNSDNSGFDPTQPGVWVTRGGNRYERVSLQIGYSNGEFSEVQSGELAEGDRVIVGYQR